MFRKLYWVTEAIQTSGQSQVLGVYTSIPDLIRHGLPQVRDGKLRLTLTKLDSSSAPMGVWTEPNFEGIEDQLDQFVKTDEFSKDHCSSLCQALRQSRTSAAA
jgi:hypothetical protein